MGDTVTMEMGRFMKAYRFFAYFIAVQVAIQASLIAFALTGLSKWVKGGRTLNKTAFEDPGSLDFTGALGLPLHSVNGLLIAVLALVLLIVSFFAKVAEGTKWASIVLLLVIVQVALGMASRGGMVLMAPLHALNAFGVLFMAIHAARQASSVPSSAPV